MSSWRDDFLSMSVDARLRYMELYCKDRSYSPGEFPPIPEWAKVRHTKIECIEFARKHQVRCLREMREAIENFSFESPPSIQGIVFLFGTWPVFMRMVKKKEKNWKWGDLPRDDELVGICSKLHLETAQQYIDLRKTTRLGEYLPSLSFVLGRFGSWNIFRSLLLSFSIDEQMDRYFRRSMEKGKPLTMSECDAEGIEIRFLKETLGKDLFNRVLYEKEQIYRRSQGESFQDGAVRKALATRGRRKNKDTYNEEQIGSEARAGTAVPEAIEPEIREKAEAMLQELLSQRKTDS